MQYECKLDLNNYTDGKSAKILAEVFETQNSLSALAIGISGTHRNRKSIGTIEMLISLNQKSSAGKSKLAKNLSDFERNRGILGKMRTFGTVKLVILTAQNLKTKKESPVIVITFGNEKRESKPAVRSGDNFIWGDRFILHIEDAFDIIQLTVYSG